MFCTFVYKTQTSTDYINFYNDVVPKLNSIIPDKLSFMDRIFQIFIMNCKVHLFKRDLTTTFYQDVLLVKFIIKDSWGTLLQSNSNAQSESDRNFITSISTRNNSVFLYYNGTNCGVGWEKLY